MQNVICKLSESRHKVMYRNFELGGSFSYEKELCMQPFDWWLSAVRKCGTHVQICDWWLSEFSKGCTSVRSRVWRLSSIWIGLMYTKVIHSFHCWKKRRCECAIMYPFRAPNCRRRTRVCHCVLWGSRVRDKLCRPDITISKSRKRLHKIY